MCASYAKSSSFEGERRLWIVFVAPKVVFDAPREFPLVLDFWWVARPICEVAHDGADEQACFRRYLWRKASDICAKVKIGDVLVVDVDPSCFGKPVDEEPGPRDDLV